MPPAATQPPYREDLPPQPPGPPEGEQHFTASETIRDLVIGMADGLTVPFALAAGLSGAVAANPLIVTAGLAEIAAGCVAMGLGGYLAARTDAQHYQAEQRREEAETKEWPEREKWEVAAILHRYGLRGEVLHRATEAIASDRRRWVDFMMRFELELAEPTPGRAAMSAATIGGAYVVGGLIPLAPYILLAEVRPALLLSCLLTGIALFGFGWLKARATGLPTLRGAVQTLGIGGLAAGVAYLVATLVGG
ncbi:VIT1/CCC1 transporter family protein [Siccirubricoccus sp. KC 17139]|uniref:VIT1/CCC1 transporter family protein n=1 Tax=Siccirubricoccus soli TaxID=2899147 RepID=A0ABT1D5L5_9PROT|nr:VIT1/CCC1 transporter family protein [Siccirubricoccus soli]MCO6416590.1 VIT1/CCC1 transporter family protein [Siccirubricoccus soli]MCP2682725.1 VIT1/CCC1 transporter family protein [Siccirubricoccus soli]